jgi:hypothetical protein
MAFWWEWGGDREREREGAEQAKERGVRRRREVMGVGRATKKIMR